MRRISIFAGEVFLGLILNIAAGLVGREAGIVITRWGTLLIFFHATALLITSESALRIAKSAAIRKLKYMSYIIVAVIGALLAMAYWLFINAACSKIGLITERGNDESKKKAYAISNSELQKLIDKQSPRKLSESQRTALITALKTAPFKTVAVLYVDADEPKNFSTAILEAFTVGGIKCVSSGPSNRMDGRDEVIVCRINESQDAQNEQLYLISAFKSSQIPAVALPLPDNIKDFFRTEKRTNLAVFTVQKAL